VGKLEALRRRDLDLDSFEFIRTDNTSNFSNIAFDKSLTDAKRIDPQVAKSAMPCYFYRVPKCLWQV
jgi:hypothetical protein